GSPRRNVTFQRVPNGSVRKHRPVSFAETATEAAFRTRGGAPVTVAVPRRQAASRAHDPALPGSPGNRGSPDGRGPRPPPLHFFFRSSDLPVIPFGFSTLSMSSKVGATSARMPSATSNLSASAAT